MAIDDELPFISLNIYQHMQRSVHRDEQKSVFLVILAHQVDNQTAEEVLTQMSVMDFLSIYWIH